MSPRKALFVFGTRPEVIKMAPVIRAVEGSDALAARICVTAQHREMIDPLLRWFGIAPHHDLDVMRPGQALGELTARLVSGIERVVVDEAPDVVLVQGDTTSSMAGALAAFYHKVPVAHVEAGLRTADRYAPFPEEVNRRMIGVLASLHFAPTTGARDALLAEGVLPETVHVTGNTVVDALLGTAARIDREEGPETTAARALADRLTDGGARRMILVTGHRRESFGEGFRHICAALSELAGRYPDDVLVYPVHLNPNVREPVNAALGGRPNVHLLEPLDYLPFVTLMRRAHLVLTDSGGVQEEAPTFGVPVLVMRRVTERREGVDAGVARLVGTDPEVIVREAAALMDDTGARARMTAAGNPYGDGKAAERIVAALRAFVEGT